MTSKSRRTQTNEQTPLITHGTEENNNPTVAIVDTVRVPSISRYRITNILRVVFIIEFLTLLIIWLVDSSNHSLVDDITEYTFTTSIFDLVVVALVKCILFIIFLTELETLVIRRLYQPDSRSYSIVIRYFLTILLLICSICTLTLGIMKLVYILQKIHLTDLYLANVYLFLIFSSIEFIGIVILIPYLTRIKLLDQPRSSTTKKKVDLKRLLSLAKSERALILFGTVFLLISSVTQVIQPYFFGKIVDDAVTSETMRLVNINVLILFGINCVGAITSFFRSWLFELSGQ